MMGATEVDALTWMLWTLSGAFLVKTLICFYLDRVMTKQTSMTKVGPAARNMFRAFWVQALLLTLIFFYFGTKKQGYLSFGFHVRMVLYFATAVAVIVLCVCMIRLCQALIEERKRLWP
jgi:hypothetical protein